MSFSFKLVVIVILCQYYLVHLCLLIWFFVFFFSFAHLWTFNVLVMVKCVEFSISIHDRRAYKQKSLQINMYLWIVYVVRLLGLFFYCGCAWYSLSNIKHERKKSDISVHSFSMFIPEIFFLHFSFVLGCSIWLCRLCKWHGAEANVMCVCSFLFCFRYLNTIKHKTKLNHMALYQMAKEKNIFTRI